MEKVNSRNGAIRSVLFFFLLYLLYLYIDNYNTKYIDDVLLIKILCVSLISLVLFVFRDESKEYLKGNWISLPLFFLIGYLPTCFQYYLRYAFDTKIDLALGYGLYNSVINKSAIISVIGLVCFLLGYLIPPKIKSYSSPSTFYPTKGLQIIACFLFTIYIIFIPKDYFAGNNSYYSNVGSIGGVATYTQRFYIYTNIAVITLTSWNCLVRTVTHNVSLSIKEYIKEYNPIFLAIMFLYLGLNIMSGDRGCIFNTIIPLIVGYMLATRKKIKFLTIVILGAIAVVAFYFLGYFRAMDSDLSVTSRYQEATSIMSQQNLWDLTGELATVIRAQHALFMYVEDHGFMYFPPLIYAILGIIPGAGLIYTTLTGTDQESIVSGLITTNYMGADHGMGTTCVGDLYISFGVLTVIIFMILLGYLFRVAANKTASFSMWGSLVFLYFLVSSPGLARETVFMLFRGCVFLMIIVYLNIKVFSKQTSKYYENHLSD